jgi:ABC-type multidrug transport system fused ATPase/permease subunit
MKPSKRINREQALASQIKRLERRINQLEITSRRYSWLRLGIVLLGGLGIWLVAVSLDSAWGWWTFFLFLGIFLAVAFLHRRLEGWIERFKIWQAIKLTQQARMNLDWEHLSEPFNATTRNSLDIDLDLTGLHSLHHLLATAISREGSQLLADWLKTSTPDVGQIVERQGIVQDLIPLTLFRDRLQLVFRLASKEQLRGDHLLGWLSEQIPSSRLKWLLPVASLWVVANLTLFGLNITGHLPAYWIISLTLYFIFYNLNAGQFKPFFEMIVNLDGELSKFRPLLRYLEDYPLAGKPNLLRLLAPLREGNSRPSAQLRKVQLATAGVGMRMNPIIGLFINLVLPWDFLFAYLAAIYRQEVSQSLPAWLQSITSLEALISLANFAHLNPNYTFPEINPGIQPVFTVERLGHPLIPEQQKVRNNFTVNALGQVALITGSNMAGKSTFIKTIGINLCLAYAGGPVVAAAFHTLPFHLHTCIRINDSLTDGFSYFYAEVKCLRKLMDELGDEPTPLLYLIDEIFRGTNNRERLIGSRAFLRTIAGKRGIGFVATHDLELTSLAEENTLVSNFHFRDEVEGGRLVFDYTIRPGPSPTSNALKIMAMEGLPGDM